MGLDDEAEKRCQAEAWLAAGTPEQRSGRPWCPEDCGCRLGPDRRGNHDADIRECGCDGLCTKEG